MRSAMPANFFDKARRFAAAGIVLAGLCAITGSFLDWAVITERQIAPDVDFGDTTDELEPGQGEAFKGVKETGVLAVSLLGATQKDWVKPFFKHVAVADGKAGPLAVRIGEATGRAPLEAAAQGIKLGPEDWAIRCNLVTIQDADLCHRFTARIIRNVKIGASPEWLVRRLEGPNAKNLMFIG